VLVAGGAGLSQADLVGPTSGVWPVSPLRIAAQDWIETPRVRSSAVSICRQEPAAKVVDDLDPVGAHSDPRGERVREGGERPYQ
jgi:hypothetical protein